MDYVVPLAKKSDSVSEPKSGHVSKIKLDNPGDCNYNLSHMEISSKSSIFSINGVSVNATNVSEERSFRLPSLL